MSSTSVPHTHGRERTRRQLIPGIDGRQLRAVGIGQVIEWFDWTAYALLAVYFADQFFPASASGLTALLGSFGILAVGFIVRPLSGLVIGSIADHFGRKTALMITVYGMGISSLVMALAPTYAQVGVAAPIILLLARVVQGMCIGGEFSTVASFAMESAEPGRRGWVAGLVNLFGFFGNALVVAVVFGFSYTLSDEAMREWGWRAVFFIGALLALLGIFLRRFMVETLDTTKVDNKVTLASLIGPMRRYPRQTIQVIGLTVGFTAMVYAWGTYFPTYANTYHGLDLQWTMLALLITNLASMVLTPLAGILSDRVGRKPTLVGAGLALTLGTVPMLNLLNDSIGRLLLIQLVGNVFICMLQASTMPAYCELFPKRFRATGYGFPYSLTVGLVGGTIPMVGTQFANIGLPEAFPWYLVTLMAVSTLFYMAMRETAFKPLPE